MPRPRGKTRVRLHVTLKKSTMALLDEEKKKRSSFNRSALVDYLLVKHLTGE